MKLAFCLSLHQMNILDKLSRNGGFTANHHMEQNISCQRNLHSAVSSALHCVCLFTAWLKRHVGCSLYLGGQDWPHGLPTRNIEIDLFSSDSQPTMPTCALVFCVSEPLHFTLNLVFSLLLTGKWLLQHNSLLRLLTSPLWSHLPVHGF